MDKASIQDIVLVGGSTRIPKIQKLLQEFFNDKELNKSINPDEAVAHGAAILAVTLQGNNTQLQCMLLMDVTPLSLRIESECCNMTVMIKRNTTIPTKKTHNFTTMKDNQNTVSVKVYEGEHTSTTFNNFLWGFVLQEITPALKRIPQLEVTFEIDENGILSVTALDLLTENKKTVTITNEKGQLSKVEIDEMVKEAEKYRHEDEKQKEAFLANNVLESYCFDIKEFLEEDTLQDKIVDVDKILLLDKCDEIRKRIDDNQFADKEIFRNKHIELEKKFRPIITEWYQNSESQADYLVLNRLKALMGPTY